MRHGAGEFLLWIEDVFRQGLLSLERDPSGLHRMARRMVDYKNSTIARRLRMVAEQIESDPDWPEKVLRECIDLYLLNKAMVREDLNPLQLLDVLQAAGYTIRKDRLPEPRPYLTQVLDVQFEQYENLRARKVFLAIDEPPWYALVLDFVYGRSGFENYWEHGQWFELEASFYPSAWPIRMKVSSRKRTNDGPDNESWHRCEDWEQAADFNLSRMGKHPWQEEWPFIIESVSLARGSEAWILVDKRGRTTNSRAASLDSEELWRMLAFSAGEPFTAYCVTVSGRIVVRALQQDTSHQWSPVIH